MFTHSPWRLYLSDNMCVLWTLLWLNKTHKFLILNAVSKISDVPLHWCMYQKIARCFVQYVFDGKSIRKAKPTATSGANKKPSRRKAVFVNLAKFSMSSIALIPQTSPLVAMRFWFIFFLNPVADLSYFERIKDGMCHYFIVAVK